MPPRAPSEGRPVISNIDRDLRPVPRHRQGTGPARPEASTCPPGELLGRKGKDYGLDPAFTQIQHSASLRYGDNEEGGIGAGDGEPGDQGEGGRRRVHARVTATRAGQHMLEVEHHRRGTGRDPGRRARTPPASNPRETKNSHRPQKDEVQRGSPRRRPRTPLRHYKRTFKQALRSARSRPGAYDPQNGRCMVPIKERQALPHLCGGQGAPAPSCNVVVIYMMDVSGSMGKEQKEIVRMRGLLDRHLAVDYNYDGLSRPASSSTTPRRARWTGTRFFRTRESGGTLISSAYKLCHRRSWRREFPHSRIGTSTPSTSADGDNWSQLRHPRPACSCSATRT